MTAWGCDVHVRAEFDAGGACYFPCDKDVFVVWCLLRLCTLPALAYFDRVHLFGGVRCAYELVWWCFGTVDFCFLLVLAAL